MAYWNRRAPVERPEWPKLIKLPGTFDGAKGLEPRLQAKDPDAKIVEGGRFGVFARCHNPSSAALARWFGKGRKG